MSQFFVMMSNQKGDHAQPMVDENEDVAFWDSAAGASEAARANPFAVAFGYEIFERGSGSQ